jgi:hypothetical protein
MSLANVIRPESKLPQYTHQDFPAMYWHADGTSYVAKSADEVIASTTPYHPEDKERAAAAKAAQAAAKATAAAKGPSHTLTKAETIAQLQAGEIPHDPTASHKSLYELLLTGIKNALTEGKIEFDATSNDAKALLGLFPKE